MIGRATTLAVLIASAGLAQAQTPEHRAQSPWSVAHGRGWNYSEFSSSTAVPRHVREERRTCLRRKSDAKVFCGSRAQWAQIAQRLDRGEPLGL